MPSPTHPKIINFFSVVSKYFNIFEFNDDDYHYVWGRLEHPNDSWKSVKQKLKDAAQLEKEIDDKEGVRCFGLLKAIKFILPTFVVVFVSLLLLCETLMNLFRTKQNSLEITCRFEK